MLSYVVWYLWAQPLYMFSGSHGKPNRKKQPQTRKEFSYLYQVPHNTRHVSMPFLIFFYEEWRNWSKRSFGRITGWKHLEFWCAMEEREKFRVIGHGFPELSTQPGGLEEIPKVIGILSRNPHPIMEQQSWQGFPSLSSGHFSLSAWVNGTAYFLVWLWIDYKETSMWIHTLSGQSPLSIQVSNLKSFGSSTEQKNRVR